MPIQPEALAASRFKPETQKEQAERHFTRMTELALEQQLLDIEHQNERRTYYLDEKTRLEKADAAYKAGGSKLFYVSLCRLMVESAIFVVLTYLLVHYN